MRGDDHRVFICPATLRADIFDVSTLSLDPFPSLFVFFFFCLESVTSSTWRILLHGSICKTRPAIGQSNTWVGYFSV